MPITPGEKTPLDPLTPKDKNDNVKDDKIRVFEEKKDAGEKVRVVEENNAGEKVRIVEENNAGEKVRIVEEKKNGEKVRIEESQVVERKASTTNPAKANDKDKCFCIII